VGTSRLNGSREYLRRTLLSLAPLEGDAPGGERRFGQQRGGVYVRSRQQLTGARLVRRQAGSAHLPVAAAGDQNRNGRGHANGCAAKAVARLEQASVLDHHERSRAPEPQSRGDCEGLALSSDGDESH